MEIFKIRISKILLGISGAFLFFSLVLILVYMNDLSSPVILHFDALNGIDFFGESYDLWGVWLVNLFFMALNIILAKEFFHRERLASYILLCINPLIGFLALIGIGTIISVN